MSTLEETILSEFREKFPIESAGCDGCSKNQRENEEHKAFLLSSLTRVREDERKKVEAEHWLVDKEFLQTMQSFSEKTGLNRKQIGKLIGVSEAAMSLYFSGKRTPSNKIKLRISKLNSQWTPTF